MSVPLLFQRLAFNLEGPQDGSPIRVPMEHEFPGARGFPDPDGFLQAGVGRRRQARLHSHPVCGLHPPD
jgi:hypothetical protein